VRDARPGEITSILSPDSDLLTPALQEMKVQPEMLLKTKDRGNENAPTSVIPGGSVGALPQSSILAPGSDLLTPAFREMKVQPEMLLKTHDREHGTRRYGAGGAHAPVKGYPGNMLKKRCAVTQSSITYRHSPMPWLLTPSFCLLTPALQKLTCQDGLPVAGPHH